MWDAILVRRRLASMAEADPARLAFGASHHRYHLGAPLEETVVGEFERRHGIRLPPSYRSFVTTVGDGGAGPYYGLFPLDGKVDFPEYINERTIPGLLGTPFPHNAEWNPHQGDRSTWISDDEYFDDRWSAGSMAICDYGCGYFFRLVVTGQLAGQVWFDSRACDGGLRPGPDFWDWYLVWLDPQRPQ